MTLAMESATMNPPQISENPMAAASYETEKVKIFDGIMKDMRSEAEDVRRAI